jgi:negative regulator of flagellin synthesis FlgM
MRISDISADALRSDRIGNTIGRQPGAETREAVQQPLPVGRPDQVQISDAGRAMASLKTDAVDRGLSAERVADIRNRILEGAYETLPMVDQVARRILGSGDV